MTGSLRFLLRRFRLRHHIKVETAFAESVPPINADADQMIQVLLNLMLNAIDAMPNGGILRLGLSRHDHQVKLTVEDTGGGIPEEHLSKVFNPFFTTKEVGKGTGLGLKVVHGIVQDHGGSISVKSEPGKGATFTVILPIHSKS